MDTAKYSRLNLVPPGTGVALRCRGTTYEFVSRSETFRVLLCELGHNVTKWTCYSTNKE